MVTHVDPMPTPAPSRTMSQLEFDQANAARIAAEPLYTAQFNAAVAETNENAISAEADAAAAAASQAAAAASALAAAAGSSAPKWVAGTYADGAVVWSPTDGMPYRKIGAGASATDPRLDNAGWKLQVTLIGAGGALVSGDIALTYASAAAMTVTPLTPGCYATLPAANMCTKAAVVFSFYNASEFDYGVKNSAGQVLGWVRPHTGAFLGLSDNASAAGAWPSYGLEKVGVTASFASAAVTGGSYLSRITIDSTRTCFIFGSTSCYAIVYDASTRLWGAPTLIRSVSGLRAVAMLSAANQVLVCSCAVGATGLEAVTLTISGTGVAPNTPVPITVASNFDAIGQLIAVGASFVLSYLRVTGVSAIRAISVSGTTPAVGAEATMTSSTSTVAPVLFATGSVVRTICATYSGVVYVKPFTVSGSSLSPGTEASTSNPAIQDTFRAMVNGNGNIVCQYAGRAAIFKLTGTTEAVSDVALGGTAPGDTLLASDMLQLSSSKTLVVWSNSTPSWCAQIVADTSGTASVGTLLTGGLGAAGNVACAVSYSAPYATAIVGAVLTAITIDVSSASPTLAGISSLKMTDPNRVASPGASNRVGARDPRTLIAGGVAHILAKDTDSFDLQLVGGRLTRMPAYDCPADSTAGVAGAAANETYIARPLASGYGFVIQRVECAA